MEENTSITHSTLDQGYDFFTTDKWNKKYHFKIATIGVPSGLLSEAIEVIDNPSVYEPRLFHILSDFDTDIENAEYHLKAKIKRGIDKRYLKYTDGEYSLGDDLELAGQIIWESKPNNSKFDYFFQIDGRKITIENFVEMLAGVESFNFKFQILDTTDDIK